MRRTRAATRRAAALFARRAGRHRAVPGGRAPAVRRPVGCRAHRGAARGGGAPRRNPASRSRASILEGGLARRTVDAFDAFHRARQGAARRRATVRRLRRAAAADRAVLPHPGRGWRPTRSAPNARLGTCTNFVNLCDLAAIAVPAGFGTDGLPVGVTAGRAGLVRGPAGGAGRHDPPRLRHPRRRDRHSPAARRRRRSAGRRRNRAVLHRRAHVRPAAERADHRRSAAASCARRRRCRTIACTRSAIGRAWCGRRTTAPPSAAKSGRCRPPRSAPCSRRCRRRSGSARSTWPTALPRLRRRSRGHRRRARHHRAWRLARLAFDRRLSGAAARLCRTTGQLRSAVDCPIGEVPHGASVPTTHRSSMASQAAQPRLRRVAASNFDTATNESTEMTVAIELAPSARAMSKSLRAAANT